MPALATIEVPLPIAALLLVAEFPCREPRRSVRPASSPVTLAIGATLLALTSVRLGLLLLLLACFVAE